MTLLAVVQDVCAAVGVLMPTSVFASLNSNRTMQEMVALANEMAQRIAYDTRDWTALKNITDGVCTGDGVAGAFTMPANYKRMLLTTAVWRSDNTQQPMRFEPDTNEWVRRRSANETYAWGEWTLIGGQMHIWPIMGAGTRATYVYLDKNCVVIASGGYGDRFMADADSFRLDERLLKLGMVWQWKAQKGSPYAEDMGSFSDALANAMGADKPSPIIIDRLGISSYANVAYPWALPS